MTTVAAWAPGRVNLIGDHTDHTGGFVLPMAIDRATTVEGHRNQGRTVRLRSRQEPVEALFPVTTPNPQALHPPWARYVAGVARAIGAETGFDGEVRSTVPVGAGLSSSAALEVAAALALGFEGSPVELARACQEAEHVATGVPCGIMDQLASAAGVEGHALLVDCAAASYEPVPMPEGVAVHVVHSGQPRRLAASPYAARRAQCEEAARLVGRPLRDAEVGDLAAIADDEVRRRARHVVTENRRVLDCAGALRAGDVEAAGRLMTESHASLRDDYEASTDALDALVDALVATPGVLGARLTGAGWGGCAIALVRDGARLPVEGWPVRPSGGATVDVVG